MSDQLKELLHYTQFDVRVCPMPECWNTLWELLPEKIKQGTNWKPAHPLILAAWTGTSNHEKRRRLKEQIEYAADHGVLDIVDEYLRWLAPEQWLYE